MIASSTITFSPIELAKAYHAIIEEEFNYIKKKRKFSSDIVEISHRVAPICHSKYNLVSIVSSRLNISQDKAKMLVEELINRGFLLNINYDNTSCNNLNSNCCRSREECYRSFHMDIALRSTDIRYYPGAAPMVASSKLAVIKQSYASPEDRCILPSGKITCQGNQAASVLAKKLHDTLKNFIGDEKYANALIEALEKYLKTRANGKPPYGYDHYQATAIIEAIEHIERGNLAAVIVAPTGSGKTEVFTTIMLAILLRNRAKKRKEKALLIYPRKMLEIDQANRFLELMKSLASTLKNYGLDPLTFGIRDGDSYEIEEKLRLQDKVLLRGLKCSNGKLYAKLNRNVVQLMCCVTKDNCTNDWQAEEVFKISRNEIKEADIIITNMWTLSFRMLSITKEDLNICDLKKVAVIVLDEAHEYESIQLGDLAHMLRELTLVRKSNGLEEPYVIVSTATLSDPLHFTEKLVNRTGKVTDLSFDTLRSKYGISLQGERLFLTLFVQLLPTSGWNTYISEWAAAILYTWLATKSKGLTPQQSIVFINNVRELNRTARSIFQETLSLGSPLDNLCRRKKTCKSPLDDLDTFKHMCCLEKSLCNDVANQGPQKLLADHYDIVFSGISQEERAEIYERFHRQELGMLFATSSLELGMDYPNVSIILNAGLDRPDSLIQRIGRGGRSLGQTLNTVLAIILIRNNPLDYRFYADPNRVKQIALHKSNLLPPKKLSDKLASIQALSLLRYAVAKELLKYCTSIPKCSGASTQEEIIKAIQNVTRQELNELDIESHIKDNLLSMLQKQPVLLKQILELADEIKSQTVRIILNDILEIISEKVVDELDQLINNIEIDDKDREELIKLKGYLENNVVKPIKGLISQLHSTLEDLEEIIEESMQTISISSQQVIDELCSKKDKLKEILDGLVSIARSRAVSQAKRKILDTAESIRDRDPNIAAVVENDILYNLLELIENMGAGGPGNELTIKSAMEPIFEKLSLLCSNELSKEV